MLVVHDQAIDRFVEVCKFAATNDLLPQLLQKLHYLDTYANSLGGTYDQEQGKNTRCTLYADHAPLSFEFSMEYKPACCEDFKHWFNGGVIYHGPVPENVENADRPTFTVDVSSDPLPHWGVHT